MARKKQRVVVTIQLPVNVEMDAWIDEDDLPQIEENSIREAFPGMSVVNAEDVMTEIFNNDEVYDDLINELAKYGDADSWPEE